MITTDATVLMKNSEEKAFENHKKKLQKYKKNPNKKLMNT